MTVLDKLAALVQNITQGQALQSAKPASPTVQPTAQSAIDQQSQSQQDHALFYQADTFPLTAMERFQTKKVFEKVIGAKFNVNDEVNQIHQQGTLNRLGLAQLMQPEAVTVQQLSAWKKNVRG